MRTEWGVGQVKFGIIVQYLSAFLLFTKIQIMHHIQPEAIIDFKYRLVRNRLGSRVLKYRLTQGCWLAGSGQMGTLRNTYNLPLA